MTTVLHPHPDITLIHADCLHYLQTLPDASIDLILTDPPYFKVKEEGWDRQWPTKATFLAWLDAVLVELARVLKPQGALYLFCGSELASDTEIMMREHFHVLNHIVWAKPSGRWGHTDVTVLRKYFQASERIFFAGSRQAKYSGESYKAQCEALRQRVFSPLITYFQQARQALGVTSRAIDMATGKQMSSHWFSPSQYRLPSPDDYAKLQRLFDTIAHEKGCDNPLNKDYDALKKDYDLLKKDYDLLKKDYDVLKKDLLAARRPFCVNKSVPYTDVWHYPSVQYYPGKHPCEKPKPMLIDMIQASSREGEVVLDCFMGSGSTGKACLATGRRFIGIEFELARFEQTAGEFEAMVVA